MDWLSALGLTLAAALLLPSLGLAQPTVTLCPSFGHDGCRSGWLTLSSSTDACGGRLLSDPRYVFIDDVVNQPDEQQIADCEHTTRSPQQIYAAIAAGCFTRIANATNLCEWYPFFSLSPPTVDYSPAQPISGCAYWGWILQAPDFGWPAGQLTAWSNAAPTQQQFVDLVLRALRCFRHGTRPLGTF